MSTVISITCAGCSEHVEIPVGFVQMTWAAGQWVCSWNCPSCRSPRESSISHGQALGVIQGHNEQVKYATPREVVTAAATNPGLPMVPAWHPESAWHVDALRSRVEDEPPLPRRKPTGADNDPEFMRAMRAASEMHKKMHKQRKRLEGDQ